MPKKRFKPPLRALCALGTLAHNRHFTARDLREYAGAGPQTMTWLKKHGHVRSVTGVDAGRKYYPTAKGWKMIEKACRR